MTTDNAYITRRLADRFVLASPGDTVTFDQLSYAIGRDVRHHKTRFLIYPAKDIAAKETGCQFKTVRGVGFQRLEADELTRIGQTARARIRHTAKRASHNLELGMKFANNLKPETIRAVLREQSALGIIEHFSRDKNLPELSENERRPLTVGQSARGFLQSIGALKSEA